jgi:hypothetical protein
MIETIKKIPNYQNMTATEIEEFLSELVQKPESIYTFNMLCVELKDVILVETLILHMRMNGLNASADSFISRGIDFGLEQTSEMLDLLASNSPEDFNEDIVTTLKLLGKQTRWTSYGNVGEVPSEETIQSVLDQINIDLSVPADEIKYEKLVSINQGTDGVMRVMARVTPVEYANGVELRRGEARTVVNDAALIAALSPIIEGLMQ